MIKSSFWILLLLSFLITFQACIFDTEQILYPENCEESHDWGKVYVSDTTKAFLKPYEGKSKVIFKDSLDNEIVFSISKTIEYFPYMYNVPIHEECSKEVNITAEYENIIFDFLSTNPQIKSIKFSASAGLFVNSRYSTNQAIRVVINNHGLDFYQQTIKDDKVLTGVYFNTKTVELLGKSYKNVITNINNCYVDSSHGILAFRDLDKKLWVFDRFE